MKIQINTVHGLNNAFYGKGIDISFPFLYVIRVN